MNEKFLKIIALYNDIGNNKLSEENVLNISHTLLTLDYFIKLQKLIGYKGIELIARQLKLKQFYQNELVLKPGEENKSFYIVLQGEIEIYQKIKKKENQIKVDKLKIGDNFGDYFTSQKKIPNLTSICTRDAVTACISHADIFSILIATDQATIQKFNEFIKKFEIFSEVSRSSLDRFYFTIEKKKFLKGDTVFKEGEDVMSDGIYFICSGEFLVSSLFNL